MLDNILILYISIIIGFVLFVLIKILDKLELIRRTIALNYRDKEVAAEALLAEEEPSEPAEESLYTNKDGKYSYLEYNKNKKRREKEKNPDDFIDDFEQAAEELEKTERKSKYAR